jgi:hypothetical protein
LEMASPDGRSALRPDLMAANSLVSDGCVISPGEVRFGRRPGIERDAQSARILMFLNS